MNIDFSTSLQIVQGGNGEMEFLNRVAAEEKEDNSLLDYSKEENSLSFAIEEERRKSIFNSGLVQESPQKKRREIFEKYKKTMHPPLPPREEEGSDLMKIFDEVFNIGSKKSSRNPSPNDQSRTPSQETGKGSQIERKHKFSIFGKKKQAQQGESRENGRTLVKLFTKASNSPPSKIEPPQTTPFVSQINAFKPKPQPPILGQNVSPIKLDQFKPSEQYPRLLPKIEEDQPYIPAIELDDFSYIETANEPNRDSIIFEGLLGQDLDSSNCEQQIPIGTKQIQTKNIKEIASPPIKVTPLPSIHAIAEANRNDGSQAVSSVNFSVRNSEDMIQSMMVHSYHRQQSEQGQMRQFNYTNDPSKSLTTLASPQKQIARKIVNIFQEQKRMPEFMRKMNQLNQVYSNLHSRNATVESINQDYQLLREESRFAIQFLIQMASDVHQAKNRKAEWEFLCFKSLTVQLFLSKDWDTIANIQNIQALRIPYAFRHKKWTFDQLNRSLKSFQGLLDYYDKLEIDGQSEHDKKLHNKIRQKYWDIEKNMIHIAEDVYSQALDCTFPLHHYIYKQYLKTPFNCNFNTREIGKLRELMSMHLDLKRKGDFLSSSVVGQKVQRKLHQEMKYICPA